MSAPAKDPRPRARLRRLRRAQGWNSRAAALAAGVLPSVYSGIETGRIPVLSAERAWFPAAERIAAAHRMLVEDVFPRDARGLVERFVPCRPGVMERVLRTRDWGRVEDDLPEERVERAVYLREVRAYVDRIVAEMGAARGYKARREWPEVSALAAVGWATGDEEGPTEMGKRFGTVERDCAVSRERARQIVIKGTQMLRDNLTFASPRLDEAEAARQQARAYRIEWAQHLKAQQDAADACQAQENAKHAEQRQREIARQQEAAERQGAMLAAWDVGRLQAQDILERCGFSYAMTGEDLLSRQGDGGRWFGPAYAYAVELQLGDLRGGLMVRECASSSKDLTVRLYGLSPGMPPTAAARAVLDRMFFGREWRLDACRVWAIREDALWPARRGQWMMRWDTPFEGHGGGWPVVRTVVGGGPRGVVANGRMRIRGVYSEVHLTVDLLTGDFGDQK